MKKFNAIHIGDNSTGRIHLLENDNRLNAIIVHHSQSGVSVSEKQMRDYHSKNKVWDYTVPHIVKPLKTPI